LSDKKLIIHHAPDLRGTLVSCGERVAVDYLIDRYASVVTNFDSVCAGPSVHRDETSPLHLCIEGDFEQTPLLTEVSRVVTDFIRHLSRVRGISPKDIVAHRDQFYEPSSDRSALCPGIYLYQHLVGVRSQLERELSVGQEPQLYDAFFEVLGVSERVDGFEVVGWVTNVGNGTWCARNDEWHVSLGLKAISEASELLIERRYPIPAGGVAPGEGFSFNLKADIPYEGCSRLDIGLVIENKFWFANTGLRPLAFAGPMRGGIKLPDVTREVNSGRVSIVALAAEDSLDECREWVRTGLLIDPASVDAKALMLVSYQATESGIRECNSAIAGCGDRDIVIVSHGVSFQDASWLAKLQRAAYADPSVAAASAMLVDSFGRVVDIGGNLHASGYTYSPGFWRAPSDRRVSMLREPGFLPVGALYLRRDAMAQIGLLPEKWQDLQLALIEWSYRVRNYGKRVRVVHSAVGIVPARHIPTATEAVIRGYGQRRELLERLSDIINNGWYG
jgi:hypothetical protein